MTAVSASRTLIMATHRILVCSSKAALRLRADERSHQFPGALASPFVKRYTGPGLAELHQPCRRWGYYRRTFSVYTSVHQSFLLRRLQATPLVWRSLQALKIPRLSRTHRPKTETDRAVAVEGGRSPS